MCMRAPLTWAHDEAGLQNSSEQRSWVYLTCQRLGSSETTSLGLPPSLFALTLIPTEAPLIASLGLHFGSLNRASRGSSSEATLQRYHALSRRLRFTIIPGW